MSTRSCIARPVGDGWEGRYHHSDGGCPPPPRTPPDALPRGRALFDRPAPARPPGTGIALAGGAGTVQRDRSAPLRPDNQGVTCICRPT